MKISYSALFSLFLCVLNLSTATAQDFGCSSTSLHAMVSWYQLAVLDEGMDEDPEGEIPETFAIDPAYRKLGKALQSLHKFGMLGSSGAKTPEAALGKGEGEISDWKILFADGSSRVEDVLLGVSASDDLQDLLDKTVQCRELGDLYKAIAGVKKPKKMSPGFKSHVKILHSFMKIKILDALEATGEVSAGELKSVKALYLKADKKIKTLVK